VVLLGDTGVGKSSLVLRFVTNNFKPYNESTIGASFMSKLVNVAGKQIKFQIWDTAGQEKYHSLAPMYYRSAAAAIIVYDITREVTFNTLKNWVQELRNSGPKDIALAIAGNKSDLADEREVPTNIAEAYAKEIDAIYLETSAKADLNVQDIFLQLSHRLPAPAATDTSVLNAGTSLRNQDRATSKKGCC
jgi:Ras-related protein Rab-22